MYTYTHCHIQNTYTHTPICTHYMHICLLPSQLPAWISSQLHAHVCLSLSLVRWVCKYVGLLCSQVKPLSLCVIFAVVEHAPKRHFLIICGRMVYCRLRMQTRNQRSGGNGLVTLQRSKFLRTFAHFVATILAFRVLDLTSILVTQALTFLTGCYQRSFRWLRTFQNVPQKNV